MSGEAAYDTLVTMTPGDYVNLKPSLATKWARTADDVLWRRSKLGLTLSPPQKEALAQFMASDLSADKAV